MAGCDILTSGPGGFAARIAFDSAARSHFTGSYIQRTGPIPETLHLQQRTADGEFGVVGMGENSKDIDLTHRFNLTHRLLNV